MVQNPEVLQEKINKCDYTENFLYGKRNNTRNKVKRL